MPQAQNIQEVIDQLDIIIENEIYENSTLAYFPILYQKVTQRIQQGIIDQEFEDNARMEKLDVIFANRYLEAYDAYKAGLKARKSWQISFEAKNNNLLLMQHLLLGMNAHINLDLGIAAAQTIDANQDIKSLQKDFNKINEVLASMVSGVEAKIATVSPLFYLIDKFGNGKEDMLLSFSINLARDGAWKFANEFYQNNNPNLLLEDRDEKISFIAFKLVEQKRKVFQWLIKVVRFFEMKNVGEVAHILRQA